MERRLSDQHEGLCAVTLPNRHSEREAEESPSEALDGEAGAPAVRWKRPLTRTGLAGGFLAGARNDELGRGKTMFVRVLRTL